MATTTIQGLFLDSGAHSLFTKYAMSQGATTRHAAEEHYCYYKSEAFTEYLNSYIRFVRKYGKYFDVYVNVDVIFNPKMSADVMQRLQDAGLRPIPVVHYGTDVRWLDEVLAKNYDYIGLGGLGQGITVGNYMAWADVAWQRICPASNDYRPLCKVHGFAMTSYALLTRYPWYSVDSASCIKLAAYGGIYVPRKYKGKFAVYREVNGCRVFDLPLLQQRVSECLVADSSGVVFPHESISKFENLPWAQQRHIMDWLEAVGESLGENAPDGSVVVLGVINSHESRYRVNRACFRLMEESKLPYNEDRFRPNKVRQHSDFF